MIHLNVQTLIFGCRSTQPDTDLSICVNRFWACSFTIADQLSRVWKTADCGFPRLFLGIQSVSSYQWNRAASKFQRRSRLLWKFHCSCCKHAGLPLAGFQLSTPVHVRPHTHTHRDHMFDLPCDWTPVQEHYLFKATKSQDQIKIQAHNGHPGTAPCFNQNLL